MASEAENPQAMHALSYISSLEMMLHVRCLSAFYRQTWTKKQKNKNKTKTFGAFAAPGAELVFLKCYVNSSSLAGPLFLLASAPWLVLTG